MNSYERVPEESHDRFPPDGTCDNWIALLDKLIVFLVFAIVVTLTVPLCNYLYQ